MVRNSELINSSTNQSSEISRSRKVLAGIMSAVVIGGIGSACTREKATGNNDTPERPETTAGAPTVPSETASNSPVLENIPGTEEYRVRVMHDVMGVSLSELSSEEVLDRYKLTHEELNIGATDYIVDKLAQQGSAVTVIEDASKLWESYGDHIVEEGFSSIYRGEDDITVRLINTPETSMSIINAFNTILANKEYFDFNSDGELEPSSNLTAEAQIMTNAAFATLVRAMPEQAGCKLHCLELTDDKAIKKIISDLLVYLPEDSAVIDGKVSSIDYKSHTTGFSIDYIQPDSEPTKLTIYAPTAMRYYPMPDQDIRNINTNPNSPNEGQIIWHYQEFMHKDPRPEYNTLQQFLPLNLETRDIVGDPNRSIYE